MALFKIRLMNGYREIYTIAETHSEAITKTNLFLKREAERDLSDKAHHDLTDLKLEIQTEHIKSIMFITKDILI